MGHAREYYWEIQNYKRLVRTAALGLAHQTQVCRGIFLHRVNKMVLLRTASSTCSRDVAIATSPT